MYTEFNGRQWSSEESYLKHKLNVRKNLKASLALECYADYTGKDDIYADKAFILLKEYRANKDKMSEQELLELSSLIAKNFDELFNKIGRDQFTFYEDGDVNFVYPEQ